MIQSENITDFYQEKFGWLPQNLEKELGHFNIFDLNLCGNSGVRTVPYKQRDFYKITLVRGNIQVQYADKIIPVHKHALIFTNPQIPYKWDRLETVTGGHFCIFNRDFFAHFGQIQSYPLFQPGGTHVFELTEDQAEAAAEVFARMKTELQSDYAFKYDALRNLAFELMHRAMKMQPASRCAHPTKNAAHRISTLFAELLERQFPIENNHQQVQLRTASEFAQQLNIHINHLNRSVKEITGKTTTTLIAERLHQEARVLLKHTDLSVSEIAYALGFAEPTHFHNFFKKHQSIAPIQYRQQG